MYVGHQMISRLNLRSESSDMVYDLNILNVRMRDVHVDSSVGKKMTKL